MKRLALGWCAVGIALWLAQSAPAAFPGRNGMFAVQPEGGHGLLLVNPDGSGARRICTVFSRCGYPHAPHWSPDGRMIAFGMAPGVDLIYQDGTCLNCQIGYDGPAFTSDPSLLTVIAGRRLIEYGVDGIGKRYIPVGRVSAAVWSARDDLAVVRAGRVLAGAAGSLRSLGSGNSPSWSPDGSQLAFDRGGWVVLDRVRTGSVRRLVRGSAPAWSPDGNSIAFIGAQHRLEVVPVGGGRVRKVGNVRGVAVDWQPLPVKPANGCLTPPGARQWAFPGGIVLGDSDGAYSAYMGCLRADGRDRLLERFPPGEMDNAYGVDTAGGWGNYAAIVNGWEDPHYGGSTNTVVVFDLRTGAQVHDRGGEETSCPDYDYGCDSTIDSLVVGTGGISAVIGSDTYNGERVIASDANGIHTLDSAGTGLTDLRLSSHTLTWKHGGSPRSATLH